MKQFCSVCKDFLDMTVVEEGSDSEVTWLKCPRCQGILPHMQLEDSEAEAAAAEAADNEFSLEALSREDVIEYTAERNYQVGDVVYHRSWNDFGRVMEKIVLPGDRQMIRVQFLNQGEVQLLEGAQTAHEH